MVRNLHSIAGYFATLIWGTLAHDVSKSAPNTTIPVPSDLLARGIEALGGSSNISQVTTMTYVGGDIYRTKGVMESYALVQDVAVSSLGSQNVSFSYEGDEIKQRIDKHHQLGPYWLFARPNLDPMNYSMVVHGGNDGFAAIVEGSYIIWVPAAPPQGYLDGLLAAFAIREAEKMSPLLLSKILSNNNFTLGQEMIGTNVWLPSVHDRVLDLSVLFDPATFLPYMIRSVDDHPLFGPSTYDLLLMNYTRVNGVSFPTRFKTILNNHQLIGDYTVGQVLVHPSLDAATFFEGPADRSALQTPVQNSEYSFGELATWSASYMWYGEWTRTVANYSITSPIADLPGLWYMDPGNVPPAYKQVGLRSEYEDI